MKDPAALYHFFILVLKQDLTVFNLFKLDKKRYITLKNQRG